MAIRASYILVELDVEMRPHDIRLRYVTHEKRLRYLQCQTVVWTRERHAAVRVRYFRTRHLIHPVDDDATGLGSGAHCHP